MMKRTVLGGVVAFVAVATWVASCKKETIDPGKWQPITFNVPKGWPEPAYKFTNNALTYDGFILGRKLFYDVRLSKDSTVSCGTCHQQFGAFAQPGHDLSHGVKDQLGNRNSPGLANMAWHTSFFWDGGVNHLESQPIAPIQNPVEMALPMAEAVQRVKNANDYRVFFENAFGNDTVNSQRIFRALAQFMGAMVSADSKYDKYMRAEAGGTMTESELNGLAIFRQHCASCHKEPLMSDFSFRNNGIKPGSANDSGRAHITREPADLYKFKVPSLRNIAITAPYMHDGKTKTLDDVLEHYRSGIYQSPTLDASLIAGISLTDNEKHDVINFLKTLTDSTFIKNPIFAEPTN